MPTSYGWRAWPGRAPIVSTQMEYSLLQRGIEREVLPAAVNLGIGILPWSPLGRGVLTGKYQAGHRPTRAARPLTTRSSCRRTSTIAPRGSSEP